MTLDSNRGLPLRLTSIRRGPPIFGWTSVDPFTAGATAWLVTAPSNAAGFGERINSSAWSPDSNSSPGRYWNPPAVPRRGSEPVTVLLAASTTLSVLPVTVTMRRPSVFTRSGSSTPTSWVFVPEYFVPDESVGGESIACPAPAFACGTVIDSRAPPLATGAGEHEAVWADRGLGGRA